LFTAQVIIFGERKKVIPEQGRPLRTPGGLLIPKRINGNHPQVSLQFRKQI
jgi:hypothetical protein